MNYLKIITDNELSQSEKILMIYFSYYCKSNDISISYKHLGKELNMSRPTLMKAVKGLEDKKIINRENNTNIIGGVGANTYKIITSKYI